MSAFKKRKIEDECRIFNTGWTEKYFFTKVKDKAVCLICHATVAVFKDHNLKRHFQTNHANFGKSLLNQELKKKASDLVMSFNRQQTVLKKSSSLQKNATTVSFLLAYKIAKQNKPFAHAEFVKDCMVEAVGVVCHEAKPQVEAISLSRRTIVQRIGTIAENIQEQLLTSSGHFEWFSIAVDESTDAQGTAQLLIYIREIDDSFKITEEFLFMESLKDTTTGKDLFESVINSIAMSGLSLNKLASITTDGAPSHW